MGMQFTSAVDLTNIQTALRGPNGAAATPTYAFTNQADAGMFLYVANVLGFATSGTLNWMISGGHLVPNPNASRDLGSSSQKPRNIFFTSGVSDNAGNQVTGARKTGWGNTPMTGTADRTIRDTATITLVQLAQLVKALTDDLAASAGHGLIGA